MTDKTVYQCIAAVAADMAGEGIGKTRRNVQQGYQFRGIDDVYNALAPVLARHGLVILPRVLSRELTERQSQKGGALFSVVVECEFDFVSAHDGSSHTVKTYGEAMDSADKATNKAMSAAYKYAAMQAFCIPVEGDNDADATTHEVKVEPADPDAAQIRHPDSSGAMVKDWSEQILALESAGEAVTLADEIARTDTINRSESLAACLVAAAQLAKDTADLGIVSMAAKAHKGKMTSADVAAVRDAYKAAHELVKEVTA